MATAKKLLMLVFISIAAAGLSGCAAGLLAAAIDVGSGFAYDRDMQGSEILRSAYWEDARTKQVDGWEKGRSGASEWVCAPGKSLELSGTRICVESQERGRISKSASYECVVGMGLGATAQLLAGRDLHCKRKQTESLSRR